MNSSDSPENNEAVPEEHDDPRPSEVKKLSLSDYLTDNDNDNDDHNNDVDDDYMSDTDLDAVNLRRLEGEKEESLMVFSVEDDEYDEDSAEEHRKRRWSEVPDDEKERILEKRRRKLEHQEKKHRRAEKARKKRKAARMMAREEKIEKYLEVMERLKYERRRNAFLQDRLFSVSLRKKGIEVTDKTVADAQAAAAAEEEEEEEPTVEAKKKKLSKLKARYSKLASYLYHSGTKQKKTVGVCGVTGSRIQDAVLEKLQNRLKPFDMLESVGDESYRIVQGTPDPNAENSMVAADQELDFIDDNEEEEVDEYDAIFSTALETKGKSKIIHGANEEEGEEEEEEEPEEGEQQQQQQQIEEATMKFIEKKCEPKVDEEAMMRIERRLDRKAEAIEFLETHIESVSWSKARQKELSNKKSWKELKLFNLTQEMQKKIAKRKAFMERTENSIQTKEFYLPYLKRLYEIALDALYNSYRAYSDASLFRANSRKFTRHERELFINQLGQLFEKLRQRKVKMYKLKRFVIISKRELATTSNPDWEGFTALDFENLKAENKDLQNKLLEKDEEVTRLRKQLSQFVTKLAIVMEKKKHVCEHNELNHLKEKKLENEITLAQGRLLSAAETKRNVMTSYKSILLNSSVLRNPFLYRDFHQNTRALIKLENEKGDILGKVHTVERELRSYKLLEELHVETMRERKKKADAERDERMMQERFRNIQARGGNALESCQYTNRDHLNLDPIQTTRNTRESFESLSKFAFFSPNDTAGKSGSGRSSNSKPSTGARKISKIELRGKKKNSSIFSLPDVEEVKEKLPKKSILKRTGKSFKVEYKQENGDDGSARNTKRISGLEQLPTIVNVERIEYLDE